MIRQATTDDFEVLFAMIEQMVADSVFAYAKPDRNKIMALLKYPKGAAFLAYRGDVCIGFVGAVITEFFFSRTLQATDVGFFILPEYRGGSEAVRLLRRIEQWARDNGMKEMYMGHSVGGKIDEMKDFYRRNGYQIGGFNSMKRLETV